MAKKKGNITKKRKALKTNNDIFQKWAKNANQQMRNIFKDEREGKITTDEKKFKLQRAYETQEYLKTMGYTKTRKNQTQINFPEGKDKLSTNDLRHVHIFLGINKGYDNNPFKEQADIDRMKTFLKKHPEWNERDYWAMRSIGDREGFKKLNRYNTSDKVIEVMNSVNAEDYEEFLRINMKSTSARTKDEQDFLDKLFEIEEIEDDIDKINADIEKKAKQQKSIPIFPY